MRSLAAPLIVAAVVATSGCGGHAEPGPVVSPTGIVYEPGIPPDETRLSQTATLYLRQDRVERALELALEGIAEDPDNPIHFFLAGIAYARLERYVEADGMFSEAERLYPAYELDVEPERRAAWAAAFNAGLSAYEDGDTEQAIEIWQRATLMSDLSPQAHRNLARVLALEGRYAEAIDVYQRGIQGLRRWPATRVLTDAEIGEREEDAQDMEEELARLLLLTDRFSEAEPLLRRQLERDPEDVQLRGDLAAALSGLGREEEARAIYGSLLSEEGVEATQLFSFGVALFRSGDHSQAARAFERLTGLQPDSRDAWFNYANSLFAAGAWDPLVEAGARLVELDPLNENAHLITARALLELGDREGARESLGVADSAPVFLAGLQLRRSGSGTTVEGRVTGNAAEPGSELRLRFVFYGDVGITLGAETITVAVPAEGESAPFEVAWGSRASAYRYEVLPGT